MSKRGNGFKDITGQKFGRLTAIEYSHSNAKGKAYWKYVCECGEEGVCVGWYLSTGRWTQCKSCIKKTCYLEGTKNPKWQGVGDLSKTYWFSVVSGAVSRNFDITISMEEAWSLFLLQNKRCALSGVELKMSPSSRHIRNGYTEHTASLDRIDSSQGYIPGNVQWVHKAVNKMKMCLSQKDLILWCKLISNNEANILNV